MKISSVKEKEFRPYGRVLPLDVAGFVKTIKARPAVKKGEVVYEPSVQEFEDLPLYQELKDKTYGEQAIEFGHCSGWNEKLNAVEYHRSSEIDIAATDLYLILGRQQDIDYETNTYDTSKMEVFFVPAGTAVELYATTLHYAPCGKEGKEFRCGVVLPKGTNEELHEPAGKEAEDRLLFAENKWLIAHKESGLEQEGAWIGLKGKNLTL
ncbi:MAG: DUF4867 family protein [Selenomonadaceae bacterium]|nr:DUF4867 family protein [Selenomonadaceae bacterium]